MAPPSLPPRRRCLPRAWPRALLLAAAAVPGAAFHAPVPPSPPRRSLLHARPERDPDAPFRAFSDADGGGAGPDDQSPVNEYLDMIDQPFFRWALASDDGDEAANRAKLGTRLAAVHLGALVLVCYPIAGATYTLPGYGLQQFAAANLGAACLTLALAVRIYSGWGYVEQRLTSSRVEYEETGWYDGDVRQKSTGEKMRDRMLFDDAVAPAVGAVKSGMLACALWLGVSFGGYRYADGIKPLFDEYDAGMLKTLQMDDNMAEAAAKNSGGRPTYCNSRYYKAVAGGAPGCD